MCHIWREIWLKLQDIYASKGPARKATLLKKLVIRRGEIRLIVLTCVDDILVCSQDESWSERFCRGLSREFKVKELGLA